MKLLLFAVLLFATPILAQTKTDLTYEYSGNPYHYEAIAKVDSMFTKKDLFEKCEEWFAIVFKDSKSILQVKNLESGVLIGKGGFNWNYKPDYKYSVPFVGFVSFTLRIDVKDGRYKYELSDFNTEGYGLIKDGQITKYPYINIPLVSKSKLKSIADKNFKDLQEQIVSNTTYIITSLNEAMKQKSKSW